MPGWLFWWRRACGVVVLSDVRRIKFPFELARIKFPFELAHEKVLHALPLAYVLVKRAVFNKESHCQCSHIQVFVYGVEVCGVLFSVHLAHTAHVCFVRGG